MVNATEGWAVGITGWAPTMIRWNGTDWSNATSPTTKSLYSVFMVNASDGWAVGAETAIHWNGTEWSFITSFPTIFESVFMVNATDGWAVGLYGNIIHWNGTIWRPLTSPTTEHLLSVYMVNATEGWAVGYVGEIIRWTGSNWIIPEFPTIIPISLLTSLTLVAVIMVKTILKKRNAAR
jgi:photosystem II stability/assembly factor-like uncharacterized protein